MSLSEYEQERQRNMERNRQMLVKLGLEKGDHSSLLVDDNKKQAQTKKQKTTPNVLIPRERSSRTAKKPALYGNGLTDEFFLSEERRDTKKVVEKYLLEQGKTFLDLKHDIHRLMESTGLSRDQVADYMQTERIRRRQQHATAERLDRPVRRRNTTVTLEEEFSDQLGPRKRHKAAAPDHESLLYIKQQQIRNMQHQQRLQAHLQQQQQHQIKERTRTYSISSWPTCRAWPFPFNILFSNNNLWPRSTRTQRTLDAATGCRVPSAGSPLPSASAGCCCSVTRAVLFQFLKFLKFLHAHQTTRAHQRGPRECPDGPGLAHGKEVGGKRRKVPMVRRVHGRVPRSLAKRARAD